MADLEEMGICIRNRGPDCDGCASAAKHVYNIRGCHKRDGQVQEPKFSECVLSFDAVLFAVPCPSLDCTCVIGSDTLAVDAQHQWRLCCGRIACAMTPHAKRSIRTKHAEQAKVQALLPLLRPLLPSGSLRCASASTKCCWQHSGTFGEGDETARRRCWLGLLPATNFWRMAGV